MSTYTKEVMPVDVMKDLLDDNWIQWGEVPKPLLIIVNDPEEPRIRENLTNGDVITIRMEGAESIKLRGNISYYDRTFPIALEIWTMEDRQRLRDIWKMIKAICFTKKHNFTGYQLIRPISYTELVNEEVNIWRGQVKLQVESAGVTVESLT